MRHLLTIVGLAAFVVMSCQQPEEVELKPNEGDGQPAVATIADVDTGLVFSPIDSSAILPADQYRYEGVLQVNNVKYDAGQGVRPAAFARVYFSDRRRPILHFGRTVGYYGMDLGTVVLNGSPMVKLFYRIPLPTLPRDTAVGFEYVKDLTATYRPNTSYAWVVAPLITATFSLSIESPDDLNVVSPAGGSIVSRNQGLFMQWTGKGNVSIFVSAVDPATKKTRPLLCIIPGANRNRAILSSKVLRLLPANRVYVFTFSLSNRKEPILPSQYPAKILVQAASVYNSYVELR